MNMKCNEGVECGVRSCRYHDGAHRCALKTIIVTSDINKQHYCGSFEERSDAPEF